MSRVKKRSFILLTLLTPILFAASMLIYVWIFTVKDTEIQHVKVVDNTEIISGDLTNTDYFVFEKAESTPVDSLKYRHAASSEHYIILYIDGVKDELPVSYALYSDRQVNADLERYITNTINNIIENHKMKAYDIENLDEILKEVQTNIDLKTIKWQKDGRDSETSTGVLMMISYILAFIIYMFILLFGMMVLRGVIEEKSNRIVEIIVSSVRPFELMIGKILGIALVALVQFLSWVLLTWIFVTVALVFVGGEAGATAANEMAQQDFQNPVLASLSTTFSNIDIPFILFAFVLFFIGGYLLYASMFASVGSAVEAEADVQQMMMPITIPLVLGLMIMVHTFQYPNSSLSFWASMIPFTSPMVMMARAPFGVPLWQMALSVVLLFGTFVLFCYFAGKIYRVGILMYGKKHNLKEMWKWMNYK
jgi:ABC-2 type transport system permease protein